MIAVAIAGFVLAASILVYSRTMDRYPKGVLLWNVERRALLLTVLFTLIWTVSAVVLVRGVFGRDAALTVASAFLLLLCTAALSSHRFQDPPSPSLAAIPLLLLALLFPVYS